jgi:hypothetical protein
MILLNLLSALLLLFLDLLVASIILNKACHLLQVKKPGLDYGMVMVFMVGITCLAVSAAAPLFRFPAVPPVSIVIMYTLVAAAIYSDTIPGMTLVRGAVIFWIQLLGIAVVTSAILVPLHFLGLQPHGSLWA